MHHCLLTLITVLCLTVSARVAAADAPCRRIVSLAPDVTEILFTLGLGDRVVGVTRYCTYPPEAKQKTIVGGFLDPSLEGILRLNPDIVFTVKSMTGEKSEQLRKLSLRVEEIEDRSVAAILSSIERIGGICAVPEKARELRSGIEAQIAQVVERVKNRPKVSAVILVGEGGEEDTLRNLFLSGSDGFYNELLQLAGGTNAYHGITAGMPSVSPEGLLTMDPDVIIHIHPSLSAGSPPPVNRSVLKRRLPELRAVREDRLYIIQADYAVIPGPRFTTLLLDFERITTRSADSAGE